MLTLRSSYQCGRIWQEQGYLGDYSGRPELDHNGNGACVFYPITCSNEKENSGYRYLGIVARCWDYDFSGAGATWTASWNWYKDKGDGAATTDSPPYVLTPTVAGNDTYGDTANGPVVIIPRLGYSPTTSNDGFRASKFLMNKYLPAAVGFFSVPTGDMEQSTTTEQEEQYVRASNFAVGSTLRGFDTTAGNSIGRIINGQMDVVNGLGSNTRRCLFQTVYPIGVYNAFADGAFYHIRQDSSGNPMSYAVKPRDIYGSSADIPCLPAMVVTCSDACQVKFSSVTAGDTWTWTASGAKTAELITPTDGSTSSLDVDPAGDTITIEAIADKATQEILHHSVGLWEPDDL
ncbi:MAG: hypothetical protein GY841_16635 [FCB group bacterium]|nr:hypothetical protein [FCB group bacterium]